LDTVNNFEEHKMRRYKEIEERKRRKMKEKKQ